MKMQIEGRGLDTVCSIVFDTPDEAKQVMVQLRELIKPKEPQCIDCTIDGKCNLFREDMKRPDCGACSYKKELIRLEGLQDERVSLELERVKCWEHISYWGGYRLDTPELPDFMKLKLTPTSNLADVVKELVMTVQTLQGKVNASTDK